MRLERSMVVRAALELLEQVGLDGLTTRRLAEELGVQGPALYWHFKNKQELIDEMARALLAEAHGPMAEGEDWAAWLARQGRRLRDTLLSHRDGARLLAGYRPSSAHGRLDPEVIFRPLLDAGFSMPDALWALLAVTRFAFGWAMDEQAAVGRVAPAGMPKFDPNQGFEFGLATIIAGLKARVAGPAAGALAAPTG
jgi:TetR/AcrR family tetracycline transcriptional repressor